MGCKDTDFFLSSKFFCDFFAKFFTFIFQTISNPLYINQLPLPQIGNALNFRGLRDLRAALWGARGRLNILRDSDIRQAEPIL